MKLYFRNSKGEKKIIGDKLKTKKDVLLCINTFLSDHNFKSYYMRTWYEDGYTWFDVGSHTEFFLCDTNIMRSDSDDI